MRRHDEDPQHPFKVFLQNALLDLYGVKRAPNCATTNGWIRDWNVSHREPLSLSLLRGFEADLCARLSLSAKGLAEHLFSASWSQLRWRCKVRFDPADPFSRRYAVFFLPPAVELATHLYGHFLGNDRFLFVSLRDMPSPVPADPDAAFLSQFWRQHWAQMQLFRDGILFGGRRYVFLGGEVEKTSQQRRGGTAAVRSLIAWFYALHDVTPLRTLRTSLSLSVVRDYLGHLSALAAQSPGKCNARIKLGFSPVFPLLLDEDKIEIRDDVRGSISQKVLTDGCGLIAADLVRAVPYAVNHGTAHGERAAHMPLPAMLQVRCVSAKGLFKGCLIVTADEQLCAPGTVIFRPSMKKSEASPVTACANKSALRCGERTEIPVAAADAELLQRKRESVLGVVDTFERAMHTDKSSQRETSDFSARLNRPLCLLLAHLGVERETLLSFLQGELDELCLDSNRGNDDENRCALQLAKRSIAIAREDSPRWSSKNDNDDDEEEDEGDDPDSPSLLDSPVALQRTLLASAHKQQQQLSLRPSPLRSMSLGEKVLGFLFAGHRVEQEAHLQQLFTRLKTLRMRHLARCNITVRNALYLVGAPDPYNELAEDEVFILPPNDRNDMRHRTTFSRRAITQQRVLVTRHPMQHPGDLRCFRAVHHPLLAGKSRLAELSSGGVIFFSTRGQRAPADEMSGGDYDGDKFVVFLSPEITNSVQCMAALSDEEEKENRRLLGENDQEKDNTSSHSTECSETQHTHTLGRRTVVCDSCQECRDPLGVRIFTALLLDAQQQMVGRYSNAWMSHAEARGPLSREALLCGHLVRVALDAAKNGVRVPFRPDLLNAPQPQHLKDELDVFSEEGMASVSSITDSSPSIPTCSSAVDELAINEFELEFANGPFAQDEETRFEKEINAVTSALASAGINTHSPQSVSGKSILQEMYEHVCRSLTTRSRNTQALHLDWDMLIVENDEERNLYDLCGKPILIDDELPRKIYSFFPQCHRELDLVHMRVTDFRQSFRDKLLSKKKSKDSIDASEANDIKIEHRSLFERDSDDFAKRLNLPVNVARLRFAGFVYLGTYLSAATSASRLNPDNLSLSYCWDICAAELHRNKIQMEKRRQGVSAFENFLPSFLEIL